MKWEFTIERLRGGRKNRPAGWVVFAKATFSNPDEAHAWMQRQGIPERPEPGWAVRVAVYP